MKNAIPFFIIFLYSFLLCGQDSLNMKKMGTLDGLGAEYNDVWGYRHGAKEYGVVGSKTAINIVEVTDCGNPTLTHQWIDGSNTPWRDFKDYEDYIYAVCDIYCAEGLQVINKNDFSHSQSTAQFTKAHNIFVEKASGRLYVVGSNSNQHGIWIYDIKTDPANPILIKDVRLKDIQNDQGGNYYIHDLYVLNDTAYCSHGDAGHRIWDVKDVNNISLIADLDGSIGYNHSSWKHPTEPYLYVAEEVPKGRPIYVYDISEIADPFTTYSFKDPLEDPTYLDNRPHNPFVLRERLYISYYHDGVMVYDVSNPELPDRIAYYDTYLDNNGSGYGGPNSFEGAWGVYPFLPSGCILVNDITYGLSTLELTIMPDTDNTMPSNDIIIDNSDKGMVFRTPDEDYIRVKVNNISKLESSTLAGPPTNKIEFGNSNLKFTSSLNGVILKNPNGDYFRLGVDDDGNIEVEALLGLPANGIKLSNEDIFFSNIRGGVKFKSVGGFCYHYTLGDSGVEEVTSITCD